MNRTRTGILAALAAVTAGLLVGWATSNHIGLLAFWPVGRDNGGCPGGGVSPTCSGIA